MTTFIIQEEGLQYIMQALEGIFKHQSLKRSFEHEKIGQELNGMHRAGKIDVLAVKIKEISFLNKIDNHHNAFFENRNN